jgi:hypothetical protein
LLPKSYKHLIKKYFNDYAFAGIVARMPAVLAL